MNREDAGLAIVTCAWGGIHRRVAATRRALARWRGQSLPAHVVLVELIEPGESSRYADLLPARRSTHVALPYDASAMRGLMEKEALLNLGAHAAPSGSEILAFLDSDVWSSRQDWFAEIAAPFHRHPGEELLLQVFLRATDSGEPAPKYSTGSRDAHPLRAGAERHPGLGWAMRRELWQRMGGLNPWAISGSGDVLLVHELAPGAFPAWPAELMAWWPAIVRTGLPRPRLTFAPVDVVHEHHGLARDRAYWDSRKVIDWLGTPVQELVELGGDGLLRWRNPRHRLAALLADKAAITDHGLSAAARRVGLLAQADRHLEGDLVAAEIYRRLVGSAPDGATLVELGTRSGAGTRYLAVEAHNANRGLRVVAASAAPLEACDAPVRVTTEGLVTLAREFDPGAVWAVWIDPACAAPEIASALQAWWPKVAAGGWLGGGDADAPGVQAAFQEWATAAEVAVARRGPSLVARKSAEGSARGEASRLAGQ
jgi:hypothetical protein